MLAFALAINIMITAAHAQPPLVVSEKNESIQALCQEFLVGVNVEPDPKIIQNTLFYLFTQEYPVFQSDHFIEENLKLAFNYGFEPFEHKATYDFSKILPKFLELKEAYQEKFPRFKKELWKNLYKEFNELDPLKLHEYYHAIPVSKILEAKALLETIRASARAKEAMQDLLLDLAVDQGFWEIVKNSHKISSSDYGDSLYLLPDKLERELAKYFKSQKDRHPILPLQLGAPATKVLEASAIPAVAQLDFAGIHGLIEKGDVAGAIYQLNLTSITIADRFKAAAHWAGFYEKAGIWYKLKSSSLNSEPKLDFTRRLNPARDQVEKFLDQIIKIKDSLKQTEEKLKTLQSSSSHDEITRGRLEMQQGDITHLSAFLISWEKSALIGRNLLSTLQSETLGSSSTLQDPTLFKNNLMTLQKELKLYEPLLKHLKKGWFN